MPKPESVENRWDILYRDYPEVYEAFASMPYRPTVFELLPTLVDLAGKTVADVGSGTGKSTFALAPYARHIVGIEREAAMLQHALTQAAVRAPAPGRVSFVAGDALTLPLADRSVDVVTGITLALYPPEQYRRFIQEGLRVARRQVVYVGISPGWYGGELHAVINDVEAVDDAVDHIFLDDAGFAYQDVFGAGLRHSRERRRHVWVHLWPQRHRPPAPRTQDHHSLEIPRLLERRVRATHTPLSACCT